MEGRMKKCRQVSPERAKVWTERSPKYVQNRKVPVVYYLCRNRQLEQPHFIEVSVSSPEGLYLRDVIERLNVLRGRGMASMYSWSCKRSYKTGFVWHDLCEDDLILPAHGSEYILKGSEIIEESSSVSGRFSPVAPFRMHSLKQLPEPASSRSHDDTSPSASTDGKETTRPHEDEISPSQHSGSSGVSPESRAGSQSSWGGSLCLTEYKVSKSEGATDASTQTDENVGKPKPKETRTQGVSTDDGTIYGECNESAKIHADQVKLNPDTCRESASPPPCSSSASSSGGKAETLESLIRADVSKNNSFRRFEEDMRMPSNTKVKASNMLMQLISCGSISVKDHSFGIIPMYRPRFSDSKFSSPLYSTSVMLGERDCFSDSSRIMGLRLEDKEYFSGSLVETKLPKEGDGNTLRRSSSYNADRSFKQLDSVDNDEETTSTRSKCIPKSIKAPLSKHPKSETIRSSRSDKPRISFDGGHELQITSHDPTNGGSKRMTEPFNGNKPPEMVDTFREEKIIKIEERLASGARIIIQSTEC